MKFRKFLNRVGILNKNYGRQGQQLKQPGGLINVEEDILAKDLRYLDTFTLENTPKFTFSTTGKVFCKVLNVHDGDTLDVAMKHKDDVVYAFKVRLVGIDTPELHPQLNTPNRQDIIASGISAKEFLENMVYKKVLPIEITGQDKYGRLLAKLYIEGGTNVSVNDILIMAGHAVSYDGGTKGVVK